MAAGLNRSAAFFHQAGLISIGELIAQGIIEKTIWRAIAAVALFLAVLVILELLEVRFGKFQNLITGEAVVVIRDGQVDMKELRKLRITVNQLEMRLRQLGISNIDDIKSGVIEANGELYFSKNRDFPASRLCISPIGISGKSQSRTLFSASSTENHRVR